MAHRRRKLKRQFLSFWRDQINSKFRGNIIKPCIFFSFHDVILIKCSSFPGLGQYDELWIVVRNLKILIKIAVAFPVCALFKDSSVLSSSTSLDK